MEIIPAIDIRDGRCVRLRQGDYADETIFDEDPVAAAQRWVDAGARWLHVVDLDGARDGTPVNFDLITAIAQLGPAVQVGGGIRSVSTVTAYRDVGVDRVILGTAAVQDRALVETLCRDHGRVLVVSLDARDGRVATDGWTKTSDANVLELAEALVDVGVQRFVYTDIARDGMLTEPNYEALQNLVDTVDAAVIASGGVASIDQLERLSATGAEAAIIGRALYDGRVDLRAAMRAV